METNKAFIRLFLFFLLSQGCIDPWDNQKEVEKAKTVADSLNYNIENNRFQAISQLYDRNFFQTITETEWIKELQKVSDIKGSCIEKKLISTNVEEYNGDHFIVLIYNYTCQKGNYEIKYTLGKEADNYKIMGHNIKL